MKQIILATGSLILFGACVSDIEQPDITPVQRERLEALGIAEIVNEGERLLLLDDDGVEIGQSRDAGEATLTTLRDTTATVLESAAERTLTCGGTADTYRAAGDGTWASEPGTVLPSLACQDSLAVGGIIAELGHDDETAPFLGCESHSGWVIDVSNGTPSSRCSACLSHIGYRSCPTGKDCSTSCSHGMFSTSCSYSICSDQPAPELPPEF